ncbi:MAG: M28 family metallopeptidase [Haloglomus sp.]
MTEYTLYEREEPNLSAFERTLYDDISSEEPWELIEEFAALTRVSGSEDEKRAAAYITERLDALGVPFERYDPELYISQPHDAELTVLSPPDVEAFETAKTVAFSNDETVRGEAVYVDPDSDDDLAGAFDAGLSVDDLDVSVDGRIVVLESILPIKAISELAEAGAAAFVGIHPHEEEAHEGILSPVWGGVPDPQGEETVPDISVVNVSRREGDRLLDALEERERLEIEVSTSVTTDWFECPIVVARVPGEAAPDNEDFALLHGHYDSWYTGVTDNATGDAGLLECARVFNEHRDQLTRDLWVGWWPGHSTGRYAGSTWFVDEFATELDDDCVAHVNVDSPGVKDATEFYARAKWMPEADRLCRDAIDDVCGKEAAGDRPSRAGDYSFNNIGIPGISVQSTIPDEIREERGYHAVGGSGGHADAWHLTTDTIEKADPDVLVRDLRVFATVVARLLTADVLPLDHRTTVRRHRESIDDYAERGGDHFDFEPIRTRLDALAEATEDFYEDVEAGETEPTEANRAIKNLSRRLTRLNFDSEGPFEQDPAVYRPPYPRLAPAIELPSLSGDTYRFQRVHLKRARNHVVQELRTAIDGLPNES